jgi:hypothetical protein
MKGFSMIGKKDPFDTLTSDTLRRAEEMCAGLTSSLSLDRRGRSRFFNGAVADLDEPRGDNIAVTVAATDNQPWFTLISDQPLKACKNALLVFRSPPAEDMKYLGSYKDSKPGNRGEQDAGRYVVQFNILRDARKG